MNSSRESWLRKGLGETRSLAGFPDSMALALVLLAAAARFFSFLTGGVFAFRDASYFFVPWREALARCLRNGEPPFWNEWASCGRAMAANPTAAAFYPVTWLHALLPPTAVVLLNLAIVLALFYAALRLLKLPPWPAAAGSLVLLFSGVFQSVPTFFGMQQALAGLSLAVAATATLEPGDPRGFRRRAAAVAAALGLSFLGGEPVVTALGGLAVVLVALWKRRPVFAIVAGVLALGLSAIQLDPAIGELSRSYRGEGLSAEHGALFWSVAPARLLTLLEPRLTGDPFAEDDLDYWGAGTFDARNPYFYDLALGALPLVLALAAWRDRRGRGALLLAGAGILLATGRHLPLTDVLLRQATIFRYPEKAWLLATFALPAAAAITLATLRERLRDLRVAAAVVAAPLLLLWLAAVAAPQALKEALWALRLGAGPTPADRVAGRLSGPLLLALASLALLVLLSRLVERGAVAPRAAVFALAVLFLIDGALRVAGTCPAAPPDAYRRTTPALSAVRRELGAGRFHDDGADVRSIAVRRAAEAGGLDPLRPLTGVLHGIRYAGENDIDRMTPRELFEWTRDTARLPWGEAKAARLRDAGVTVVRTAAPGPDPPGVVEVASSGGDRILRLEGARPELSVEPAGEARIESQRNHEQRLLVRAPGGGRLLVARTWDPSWRATVDGGDVAMERVGGLLAAVPVPAGESAVVLRYANTRIRRGALISALTTLVLLALWRSSR